MVRMRWARLLVLPVILGPLVYMVLREELRQSRYMPQTKLYSKEVEDALNNVESESQGRHIRDINTDDIDRDNLLPDLSGDISKRLEEHKRREKALQLKVEELYSKLQKCSRFTETEEATLEEVQEGRTREDIPTVFIVTPTFKRFVQKAELTRVSQALKGVKNIHWIIVEDSKHKTELVEDFLERTGLMTTHLNIRTPDILRRHKGEFRRFKPRGVYQRNLGIKWIRDNIDYKKTPGVVYFADDDNTYDSRLFEEIRWIKGVGVWPVAFTSAARWGGPICKGGKVIGFHAKWGRFRPFPIDMASFAINIKKLIVDHPNAKFKALRKPGMQESSLLMQITRREELEPRADDCTKVFVWHTRTEPPRDSIRGEKELTRRGRPSNPDIET